jgi:hypothetical protein
MKDTVYKANVTLTGLTPLLMHRDDVIMADKLQRWRKDPANKNLSVNGDDRSPPWTWMTYLYSDGKHVALPADNLMACFRDAGARVTLQKTTSMKAVSQSGLYIEQEFADLFVAGKQIPLVAIDALQSLAFEQQQEAVAKLGFKLHLKRAGVGKAKHVRVRPCFPRWSIRFQIEVLAKEITRAHLERLINLAGDEKGLGDWRPGAPKGGQPGRFGCFTAEIKFD